MRMNSNEVCIGIDVSKALWMWEVVSEDCPI